MDDQRRKSIHPISIEADPRSKMIRERNNNSSPSSRKPGVELRHLSQFRPRTSILSNMDPKRALHLSAKAAQLSILAEFEGGDAEGLLQIGLGRPPVIHPRAAEYLVHPMAARQLDRLRIRLGNVEKERATFRTVAQRAE